jgi:branched-chain amino acid transport system permease protein
MRPVALIALVIAVAALAAIPFLDRPFLVTQFSRIAVYAIFAMSLDLLVGYCGLVSLGHAAFFGVAAYTTAMFASKAGLNNVLVLMPLSLLAAAAASAVIGLITLRARGVYFIMATLAFAQVLYFVVHDNPYFGGSDGLLLLTRFRIALGELTLIDLGSPVVRYYLCLASAVIVLVGLQALVQSPFGRVLRGIKTNEQRMRALGYPVERYKFVCFVIGGTLAGLAGHLYVVLTGLADPSIVDWLHSAQLLMMLIVGGIGTLFGGAIGAFVMILFTDQASELTEHWKLLVGVLVIAITLLARGGIVGIGAALLRPLQGRGGRQP